MEGWDSVLDITGLSAGFDSRYRGIYTGIYGSPDD